MCQIVLVFLYETRLIFYLDNIYVVLIPYYYIFLICIIISARNILCCWYLGNKTRLWMSYFIIRSWILVRFMISCENLFWHLTKLFKEYSTTLFTSTSIFIYLVLINVWKVKIISLHGFFFPWVRAKKQINPSI